MTPPSAAVLFEQVSVKLGGVSILRDVDAHVPQGGCTVIIGPNGAGKTTLLLAILKQVSFQGNIKITTADGKDHPQIGYVPQRLAFDRGLPMTVMEFMLMGPQRRPLWFGAKKVFKQKAMELLQAVKAEDLVSRRLGALSGGEMQRILLALALQQEPDLLILDEPAAGVDFKGEQLFCELLDGLRLKLGFTQLMVSHDLAMATHHATHVICVNRKVAAEGPPKTVLTPSTLTAIFGLHMGLVDARAMPTGDATCRAHCCSGEAND